MVIIIKQIHFENFTSLACDISDKFDMVKDDFGDIAIIAKYEEAKEIIAELVCIGHSFESIEIDRPDWKNYYDEYLISLNFDGIWCQPMKVDGKYLTDDSTITYILDNCSSIVIPQCKGKVIFEVGMADDDEYDCDGYCECACKEETKPTTSTNQNFYINGKSVSKEVFDEYDKAFKARMKEFEDEMDTWRRMLFRW